MHPIWQLLTTRRAAPLRYLSLCSGIEAATVAWHPLGWVPVAFAEVEPFPSAVLAHHWPHVPNLGDMTKWREWDEDLLASTDVVVAGCPCQAFSVAGLRNSLDDERGNLTLIYVHILDHIDALRAARGLPPVIIVYENVPGLLSTKDNAFGCFLGALAGEDEALVPSGKKWSNAGYVRGPQRAIAWRIIDAQFVRVAQRRRRVFLVASAGDRCRPEQVLFESEGVRRDTPPRRETEEEITPTIRAGAANGSPGHGQRSGDSRDELIVPTFACRGNGDFVSSSSSSSLRASGADLGKGCETLVAPCWWDGGQVSQTLDAVLSKGQMMPEKNRFPVVLTNGESVLCVHGTQDPCVSEHTAFALGRNQGGENAICFTTEQTPKFNADCALTLTKQSPTGGGQPQCVAYGVDIQNQASTGDIAGTLCGESMLKGGQSGLGVAVAFATRGREDGPEIELGGEVSNALRKSPGSAYSSGVLAAMAVRRLTPVECARLQGFPDFHCRIPWRGKAAEDCPDGPQYKAYGNSMATPCMRFIGEQIVAALRKS